MTFPNSAGIVLNGGMLFLGHHRLCIDGVAEHLLVSCHLLSSFAHPRALAGNNEKQKCNTSQILSFGSGSLQTVRGS